MYLHQLIKINNNKDILNYVLFWIKIIQNHNYIYEHGDYRLRSKLKINNCLKLKREHRTEPNGHLFLTEVTNVYTGLFESSEIHSQNFKDRLISLDLTKTKNKLLMIATL